MLRAVAGTVLLLLGGAWAFLLLNMENCTGAKADSLSLGGTVVAFNIVGFLLLSRVRASGEGLTILTLPAMLAAAYYSWFSLRFASGWLSSDISSCAALTELPFERDGREAFHVSLWLGATLSFWVGLTYVVFQAVKRKGSFR